MPRLSDTEAMILQMLVANPRPTYGLELIEESDGKLKRGTAYVTLHRMEEKGFVQSEAEKMCPEEEGRPRRRLYKITGLGQKALLARELMSKAFAAHAKGALP